MALKGWQGAIRVATSEAGLPSASDVANVESVSITHGPNLEAVYAIGSRQPQVVKEGNIEIGLEITKKYIDNTFAGYAGVGGTGEHTSYYVGVYPEGYASGKVKIVLFGKFNDWSLDISQDGYAVETVAFIGKTVSVGTIS
jgi:hypothetical protein